MIPSQASSGFATSVSGYILSDDTNNSLGSQQSRRNGQKGTGAGVSSTHNRIMLRSDENIQKIVSLGLEDKLIKTSFSKVDLTDALVKVSQNLGTLSVKQSANFLFAISKLLQYGYTNLNQELKDFFVRFKDHIMKQQQQQQQQQPNQQQPRSTRKANTKKRLRDAAKELADNLSGGGSNIDERSNSSIQQPRHISSEERLNFQEQNLISPLLVSAALRNGSNDGYSSSENSNGFDNLANPINEQRRLDLLGQEEGSVAGDDGPGGAAGIDFDGFQYDFSDKDSSQGGGFDGPLSGEPRYDLSGELQKMGDFSDRLIKKIAVNYAGQQSSKKKNKIKKSKQDENRIDLAQGDESFEYDVEVLAKEMEVRLEDFFAVKRDGDESAALSIDQTGMNTILSTVSVSNNEMDADQYLNQSIGMLGDNRVAGLLGGSDRLNKNNLVHANQLSDPLIFDDDFIAQLEKTMQLVGPQNQQGRQQKQKKKDGANVDDYELDDAYQMDLDQDGYYDQQQYGGHQNNNDMDIGFEEGNQADLGQLNEKGEEDYTKMKSDTPIKALTEDEKKKQTQYENLYSRMKVIVPSGKTAEFKEVYSQFKNQKNQSELFYDFLELQKLGMVSLTQTNQLGFSPIQIEINQ